MAFHTQQLARIWTDDFLDLLNYAKSVGDIQWQEEIIATMKNKNHYILEEAKSQMEWHLWNKFDEINRKMLALFTQIRTSVTVREARELHNEMWELKLQRIRIERELRIA